MLELPQRRNAVAMGFWVKRGMFEIYVYLVCSIAAALMTAHRFAAGHPPAVYWVLIVVCAIGVARIFTLAWREDRSKSG